MLLSALYLVACRVLELVVLLGRGDRSGFAPLVGPGRTASHQAFVMAWRLMPEEEFTASKARLIGQALETSPL